MKLLPTLPENISRQEELEVTAFQNVSKQEIIFDQKDFVSTY